MTARHPTKRRRRTASTTVALLVVGALTAAAAAVPRGGPAAPTGRGGEGQAVFFDDFTYRSSSDPAWRRHRWSTRTEDGSPGVDRSRWSPSQVIFQGQGAQRVMGLQATTDGTARGTVQAEVVQAGNRFFTGTYAARIRFSDRPARGADGDHVNQTFFAISPLRHGGDQLYSELDFAEYLPNGGWGLRGPVDTVTSYHTYWPDPWKAQTKQSAVPGSLAGWHLVSATVTRSEVRYYVDGRLVADHDRSGPFDVTPRRTMALSFNQWFIDLTGHRGTRSTYRQDVDWTVYVPGESLSARQVEARVAQLRHSGTAFVDTLGR